MLLTKVSSNNQALANSVRAFAIYIVRSNNISISRDEISAYSIVGLKRGQSLLFGKQKNPFLNETGFFKIVKEN
ncbi:hypothetical protein LPBF_05515 [Flavobacterium crassostreae]|uniref:Uncharacterized protein n=1 Tax=Flavobacterium crassostreae TaxID=1763534 RepID=A0A1B9E4J8_9FLAO|nr:hypothetical protein LPBF_05515 [Flavobacterium crassostreae]